MEKNNVLAILGAVLAYVVINKQKAYAATENPIPGEYATSMPVSSKKLVSVATTQSTCQPTTPIVETVVQPTQPPVLQERYFYAEYELPLFNIINRKPVLDIINRITSFSGGIPSIKDIKKIDLSDIPSDTWVSLGFNLAFSVVCSITGPIGWVIGGLQTYFGWANRPDKPDKMIKKAISLINTFASKFAIDPKDGIFLGLLAKNRVNSAMVPLIAVEDKNNFVKTYVTTELLPMFLSMGYVNTGYAVGYVSRTPFENSCILKIMYNILLMDFMLVIEGSEFDRILAAYDYIPIATLGYISTKIQKGPESIYVENVDQIEMIQSLSLKGFEFLTKYQSTTSGSLKVLTNRIGLPSNTIDIFPHTDVCAPPNPLSTIRFENPYMDHVYKVDKETYIDRYTFNIDYSDNSNSLPKSLILAPLYESVNTIYNYSTYIGIDAPPLGAMTNIIVEKYGTYYQYSGRCIFIPKNTERILIRQINGAIIEIVLGSKLNSYQKFAILQILRDITSSDSPKIAVRAILGQYLVIQDGRPLYNIENSDYLLNNANAYKQDKNSWYNYTIINKVFEITR